MFSQESIFNLALNELLLARRITNAATDTSNENKVLQNNYQMAFYNTLESLDLNSTSTQLNLALIAQCPTHLWQYAYQYPPDCVFFRRIQTCQVMDNRVTHEPKIIGVLNGQKVIFTNKDLAIGEYISNLTPIGTLNATVILAIAQKLATLCAPLITGKGAGKLIDDINKKYILTKADAQALDQRENFNYVSESIESEFVQVRTSFY